MSRTGFERHKHSRIRIRFPSEGGKGFDLGMRLAASVMIPLGNNLAPLYNQGSDHWIRVRAPPPFPGKLQYSPEKLFLLLSGQTHGFNRLAQG